MILPCEKGDPVMELVQGDGLGPATSQLVISIAFKTKNKQLFKKKLQVFSIHMSAPGWDVVSHFWNWLDPCCNCKIHTGFQRLNTIL